MIPIPRHSKDMSLCRTCRERGRERRNAVGEKHVDVDEKEKKRLRVMERVMEMERCVSARE